MRSSILFGASLLQTAFAAVQFGGANIAGFDFGCGTDGTCTTSGVVPPISSYGGSDGQGQMAHFVSNDNFNIFRLPVGWQYLVNNVVGGTLDATNLAKYDTLVQSCLSTGAHCIIDIHNYARWNGQVIGQGGPTNDEFADLWSQLATKYASESNVIFGIMNEPHDISDMTAWGATVQAAVTAIRKAGASTQMLLLPGTDYASAASFVANSASALIGITNPDGTTDNLIFDVHKYLDSDGSGTNSACASDEVSGAFSPLATYLRTNGRKAILSETGGGPTDSSCLQDVCAAIDYLNENDDVYVGYVGWAAGSFASSYVLSMTPSGSNSTGWTDQELVTKCFARSASSSSSTTTAASSSVAVSTSAASTSAAATSSAAVVVSSSSSSSSAVVVDATTTSAASAATTPAVQAATTTSAPSSVITSASSSSSSSSSSIVYYTPTTFATSIVRPTTSYSTTASAGPTSTPTAPDDDDTCEA